MELVVSNLHVHFLTSLPDGMGCLNSLKVLIIRSLPNLSTFPEINNPTSLQVLQITDCPKLSSLTDGISCLRSLWWLNIKDLPTRICLYGISFFFFGCCYFVPVVCVFLFLFLFHFAVLEIRVGIRKADASRNMRPFWIPGPVHFSAYFKGDKVLFFVWLLLFCSCCLCFFIFFFFFIFILLCWKYVWV